MAFGQQAGPPATHRQVQELLALVQEAGHEDFRDARRPLGFTQRQAGGKFTRDEAEAWIAQLQDGGDGSDAGADPAPPQPPAPRLTAVERTVRTMPADVLAAELQRRGWAVMEP
jgi:hypothetical protein